MESKDNSDDCLPHPLIFPDLAWSPSPAATLTQIQAWLLEHQPEDSDDIQLASAFEVLPPFYRDHRLVRARLRRGPKTADAYFLVSTEGVACRLDGRSTSIHEINRSEGLTLESGQLLDYLRFFLAFLNGGKDSFVLIDRAEQLTASGADHDALEELRSQVIAPVVSTPDEGSFPRIAATLVHDRRLFMCEFSMYPNGVIEMLDDNLLAPLDGIACPSGLELDGIEFPETDTSSTSESSGEPRELDAIDAQETNHSIAASAAIPTDRQITAAVVQVLLKTALLQLNDDPLLRRFDIESGSGGLRRLAQLAKDHCLTVVVESDIPFIEEIVIGLIDPDQRLFPGHRRHHARAQSGDESMCTFSNDLSDEGLSLVSFHAYRRITDVERVAYQLSLGEGAVLIGCRRFGDVPEPLRRICDLRISLPRLDEALFPSVMQAVFGAPLDDLGPADDRNWMRFVLHTDFHTARRLRLSTSDTMAYLKDRCRSRIQQMTPQEGPALADLDGMTEARQIAQDLIDDITAARHGLVPWSDVDRGLLLAGPSGVGKTTLAKAIARDCGVRFIVASATQWQSHGALDAHLRAISETFAEARRYSPCILFIDEVDSLGNRELLAGHNAHYQVEVINAVLEQMQGLDPNEPVIIIGATNFPERVDPALKRAGRLDQVVPIPLPNVAALKSILDAQLQPYLDSEAAAQGIDTQAIAELVFGSTGADLEFIVRGAVRRARKAERAIRMEDLLAEATHRPRSVAAGLRLSKEEQYRVAVHESGHAIASIVDHPRPETLRLLSIIPRSNGTLGFVARAPFDGAMETHSTLMAKLRSILAGRAAEELVFGPENVSSGAGGNTGSDLAVATRLARDCVCRWGLGRQRSLLWTEEPSSEQMEDVEQLLQGSYQVALNLLARHRHALMTLADRLLQDQELSGELATSIIRSSIREIGR